MESEFAGYYKIIFLIISGGLTSEHPISEYTRTLEPNKSFETFDK